METAYYYYFLAHRPPAGTSPPNKFPDRKSSHTFPSTLPDRLAARHLAHYRHTPSLPSHPVPNQPTNQTTDRDFPLLIPALYFPPLPHSLDLPLSRSSHPAPPAAYPPTSPSCHLDGGRVVVAVVAAEAADAMLQCR